jgi:hypothetical protein
MAKKITIAAFFLCFFFENIVVDLVFRSDAVYCLEDSDESGTSDNEESGKKEKKEEYRISAWYKLYFSSIASVNTFHCFDEKIYFIHCLEINSPPPDIA